VTHFQLLFLNNDGVLEKQSKLLLPILQNIYKR